MAYAERLKQRAGYADAENMARLNRSSSPAITPPVSIILYVHNGMPFLPEALDSVLAQTHEQFELCVVDDGSDDDTPDVLAAAAEADDRVRVQRQDPLGSDGLHHTVNNALAMTRHELIAIANADDVWREDKLERQVAVFKIEPNAGEAPIDICTHDATFIDDRGRVMHGGFSSAPSPFPGPPPRPWQFVGGNPVPNPTVMFHRSILRRIGLQELGQQHDHQFWFKATVHGCRFHSLPDRLIRYRLHDASESTSASKKQRIAETHRASATMMVERYPIEVLVPELLYCQPDDHESRAWAHSFLAATAAGAENWSLAAELWRRALASSRNPAIGSALGIAALRDGDELGALRLLGLAAGRGSVQASTVRQQPDLADSVVPQVWSGPPPLVAELVDRGNVGELEAHLPPTPVGVHPLVLSIPAPRPERSEVAAELRTRFDRRGGVLDLAVLVTTDEALAAVVQAYDQLTAGQPAPDTSSTIDGGLQIELIMVHPDELKTVELAHLMEGSELASLEEGEDEPVRLPSVQGFASSSI